jgi:hypothetical protein
MRHKGKSVFKNPESSANLSAADFWTDVPEEITIQKA